MDEIRQALFAGDVLSAEKIRGCELLSKAAREANMQTQYQP